MGKMNHYLTLFVAMFLLLGCATRAEQQYALFQQSITDASSKYQFCRDNMKLNQTIKYVYENFIIEEDNSSNKYQLLSSTQKINEEIKSYLISFINENNKCRKVAIDNLSKAHPSFVTVITDSDRLTDNLFGRLLSGEINIGEFNRLLQEARSSFEKEWKVVANKIDSAFTNDHNLEIANWQRAAAALQNLSIQQQQINQNQMLYNNLSRPRTTNCNMIGNYVNCTSY